MKIYVVAHKKTDNPLPPDYVYMQVNAANNEVFCNVNDALGEDNISLKNPYYCELTAAYWIWKNDKTTETVGLAHYRRFLTTNRFSHSIKYYLKAGRVEKLLKNYDFISTKLYKTNCAVKEHISGNVHEKDVLLLREVIKEKYPEYLTCFDKVFNGNESYLLNMFICKKPLWDKYYSWLFSVFDELEKYVDMTGYTVQQQRLYGFLSEILFTVFVFKNGYKVKSFPTHIVGESKCKIILQKIRKILHLNN